METQDDQRIREVIAGLHGIFAAAYPPKPMHDDRHERVAA
jgi:hypothetical protein